MTIDWTHFTPGTSFLGGILIGAACVALLLFNGRIAGVSGIVGATLQVPNGDTAWRFAFIGGLMAAPSLAGFFMARVTSEIDASWPVLVLAGVLVGYGARLANGCTSGHGVCGLSNFSKRSLVAVLTFMATAFLTAFLTQGHN